MKLISWNVNGIRAVLKKGFLKSVKEMNPDVLCIQETKAHPDQVDVLLSDYKYHYWNSAEKKGYSGTAVFSKVEPVSVCNDIGVGEHDKEGRVICLEYEKFFLVNVYVPNSGRGLPRLEYRKKWDKDFCKYLKKLVKKKPIIVCGDFNVAHKEIDLANPKSNYNKTAGFTQDEIDGMDRYVSEGFIDTFREFKKGASNYTYWSYMFNARARNGGWRIDYFLVSKSFIKNVKDSFILPKVMGSDHCPVGVKIK